MRSMIWLRPVLDIERLGAVHAQNEHGAGASVGPARLVIVGLLRVRGHLMRSGAAYAASPGPRSRASP